MRICRLRTCDGRLVNRFSLTLKVICDQAILPARSQHLVVGYQGNMGQLTHHRLDRLQIVSVESLRDQTYEAVSPLEDQQQTPNMLLEELLACEMITRMLLSRIFRGHTCGGQPYLDMRVPQWHSCENLAGYR